MVSSTPATLEAELRGILRFLLELGSREGVLHFGDLASITNMFLGATVDLPALGCIASRNFAAEAFCTIVGTDSFPLMVVEGIKGQELQAFAASCHRNTVLSESRPIHDLSTQGSKSPKPSSMPLSNRKAGKRRKIKQSSLLRTLLAATVPKVTSTFLSTLRSKSTAGRVFLCEMCRHGVDRRQRDLTSFDFQHRIVSSSVQVPVFLLGQDGVHFWHFHSVQLPFSIWEAV